MTDKPFVVVNRNGMKFLGETKTNYLLPFADIRAMCILLNYIYATGNIPNVDTYEWWKTEVMQEYLKEDEWEDSE